jgi:hypothetical protein
MFINFLKGFDTRMRAARRMGLLSLNMCATHPPSTSFLRNMKIAFLPPNCTSMLQSHDSHQLHVGQLQETTGAEDNCTERITEVKQLYRLCTHSFSKVRFSATNHDINMEDDQTDEEDWQNVSESQVIIFTEFVNCDSNVTTAV